MKDHERGSEAGGAGGGAHEEPRPATVPAPAVERADRESEERYRMVLRSAPLVQWAIDRDGIFTLSEGRGLATLGLSPGQVVGVSVYQVYAQAPEVIADYERARSGESFRNVNVVGNAVFESAWAPLVDANGVLVGVTGVALDITERIRAEEAKQRSDARLVVAERLAATGRLAAGVAHEVNNPLSYVLANLDAALDRLRELGADAEVMAALEDARNGAERVREIIRDLRLLSRSGDGPGVADACAVARSALALTRNELRHRATVVSELAEVAPVAMREPRLAQVLVNLLLNAAQALPEGHVAENAVRLAVRARGEQVEIEVSDSGVGMTPEVQARIFDPFYSTRAVGEGMGLGLSLVHSLVTEAGGTIEVESEPGRGSLFRVLLPAMREQPPLARTPRTPAPTPTPPASRLRVLVVDDEPLVARANARMLAAHDVAVSVGGREALRHLSAGERYDAIFCDLMMPDVTGIDLHEWLLAAAPEQASRMVFVTGGACGEEARQFLERLRPPLLEKPFTVEQMQKVLDGLRSAARPA